VTRTRLAVAVFVLFVSGCRCGGGPVITVPDLRADPQAADFTACPTLDENKMPVKDVFPGTSTIKISNLGKADAKAKFTFSGPDAVAFSLRVGDADAGGFRAIASPAELDVFQLSDIEVQVAFAPTKKGAHTATLTIDDGIAETTTDPVISLIGSGLDLPSQPTIETGVEQEDGGFTVCGEGAIFTDCELGFPLVQFDTAVQKKIRITNKGCPALKVSSIKVASDTGGTESVDFRLVSPPAPSAAAPISLNIADGTQTIEGIIEFKPTDTGAGNELKNGFVIVNTNDPVNMSPISAPGVLSLRGEGLRPALAASPTSCDFSRPSDLCGNNPKITDRAKFVIRNDGNATVRLDEVKFKSSGNATSGRNGRFTLVSNPTGMTIPAGGSLNLEVTHSDAPLYVIDELTVKSKFAAGGIPSGDVSFALFGGRQPCLDTEDEVNFNNAMTPVSARPFVIRNQRRLPDGGTDTTQCGALVLSSVTIVQNPFFKLPMTLAPGTTIPPGGEETVDIQYTRPASGGMQVGKLQVVSNDPFFGPPAGTKEINVISASPFDPPPECVLKGCIPAQLINDPNCTLGAQNTLQVNLSMISQSPKTMTVSGGESTDFDGATMGRPTEYRFQLLSPIPAGATAASLAPNIRGTVTKAVLQLPATGLYRINMTCFDARGQAGQPASLNVNVLP